MGGVWPQHLAYEYLILSRNRKSKNLKIFQKWLLVPVVMLRLNLSVISRRDDHLDNKLILPIAITGKEQCEKVQQRSSWKLLRAAMLVEENGFRPPSLINCQRPVCNLCLIT